MKWMEVKIITKREAVDAISERLYILGVKGVAIEDVKDLKDICSSNTYWDYIDPNVFELNDEKVNVKAYFPETSNYEEIILQVKNALDDLKKYVDIGDGIVETSNLDEEDWSTAWMKYYKPVKISEHITIKPTWEEYKPGLGEMIIEMDPGMAFGTGTHETTRMCIKMIEKYLKKEDRVVDVGCGTGILGISAVKLGAKSVDAVDIDEVAVKSAKKNAEINKVIESMDIKAGNLIDVVTGKFDLVVANIIADAIIILSKSIKDVMKEESIFISSGIIKEREEDVLNELSKNFDIIETIYDGEWVCIVSKAYLKK